MIPPENTSPNFRAGVLSVFHIHAPETTSLYLATFGGTFALCSLISCGFGAMLAIQHIVRYFGDGIVVRATRGESEGSHNRHVHWYAAGVVVIHAVSGGASIVSVSLVHVTLSATYWLVTGAALVASAVVGLVFGVSCLAALGMAEGMARWTSVTDPYTGEPAALIARRLDDLKPPRA